MAQQLTMEEREVISQMCYVGQSAAAIARRLSRHPTTIGRELKRNGTEAGYSAVTAQQRAEARRRDRLLVRKMERPEINEQVRQGLARSWSPDQIAGRLRRGYRRAPQRWVSHQTIYNWIKRDAERAHWETLLRRGGRRRPKNDRRGKLPKTVEIARRPPIVAQRKRFGDWEGDTMAGAPHGGALVTHVERKSGYLMAGKLKNRKSEAVNRSTRRLFSKLPAALRRTLTLDNGKEFARHDALSRQTGLAIYFAQPYAAWQRGANENANGLLRQFFPKGTDFNDVSHHEVAAAVDLVNNRPRKRLKYRTPSEVLKQHFRIAFEI